MLTVMGVGTVLIYAADWREWFNDIDGNYLMTFEERKETVSHLFWRKSSVAGEILYTGHLAVSGGIKLGNITATCGASNAGTLKYIDRCLSYCNGVNRIKISCVTYGWESWVWWTCSVTSPTIWEWWNCTKTCGGGTQTRTCTAVSGTQTRTVVCKGSDGSIVADSVCSGIKPLTSTTCTAGCGNTTTSQSCNAQACITYSRYSSDWSGYGACSVSEPTVWNWWNCSATCGGGTQTRTCTAVDGTKSRTRTVYCKSSAGTQVNYSYCSVDKPSTSDSTACTAGCGNTTTSQSCNTQACSVTCADVTDLSTSNFSTATLCSAGTASSKSFSKSSGLFSRTCGSASCSYQACYYNTTNYNNKQYISSQSSAWYYCCPLGTTQGQSDTYYGNVGCNGYNYNSWGL
jgi:hypothetical protein